MKLYASTFAALSTAIVFMGGSPLAHARDDIELKIMGVSFMEAPPGRDKSLLPFGANGALEKVEITAIAAARASLFNELTNSFFDKGDVRVTAIFPDKSTQSLGQAEIAGFPKFSTDGRARSFTLAISRLPDRSVTGLIFEGTVPLSIAKGTVRAVQAFDPERSGPLKLGGVEIKQFKMEGKSLQFQGNDALLRIKSLSAKLASGQVVKAERGGWGRMNDEYNQTWKFDSTVSRGELQAELYEGLETIRQPVHFVIGKPW